METTLHRQLKAHYAPCGDSQEVRLDGYRIDAIRQGGLVEIQLGSLAAIRDKIARLLPNHRVTVVKPIVVRKQIVKLSGPGGIELLRRHSPKRGSPLDLFHELVYFTRVFPHPRLRIESPLVEIEEWRHPGHGRRRRWRQSDFEVQDQKLLAIHDTLRLSAAHDLWQLMPGWQPQRFHTGEIAAALTIDRWIAQRIAYCLREMGAAAVVGKQGNALLYAPIPRRPLPPAKRSRRQPKAA
jgi:hypothetical protein